LKLFIAEPLMIRLAFFGLEYLVHPKVDAAGDVLEAIKETLFKHLLVIKTFLETNA